jgi:hypothetical protein
MAETLQDVKALALALLDQANEGEVKARELRARADRLAGDAATLRETARLLGEWLDGSDPR